VSDEARIIDRVAVALCTELGIDATRPVVCGLFDTLTPAERILKAGEGPGDDAGKGRRGVNPSVHAATWQLYRADAAKLLAGETVLNALLGEAQVERAPLQHARVPEEGDSCA
jgi:hypothetical protein